MVGALDRHLALCGFMGAGKSTIGRVVSQLTERPFVDTDREIERLYGPIPELFDQRGEAEFRELEQAVVAEALAADEPSVIALGGGAVTIQETRERLARRAFTVWVEIGVDLAWARVRGGKRPLAQDEASFRALYEQRADVYLETCDGVAENADDALLECLQVAAEPGLLADLDWLIDGRPTALVADERVLAFHDPGIDGERHPVPSGETAKRLEVVAPLWDGLGIGRDGILVAFGGGTTTDLAGFVAATYLRGIPWIAVPTSLVGQVDAAIGGKTGIDLTVGKNLAGAFHFPESVVIDTELLATLPEAERRQGMAEVVKTGLLAGRSYWELEEEQMVRATAAYKAGIVMSDPYEHGRRAILNLGHTFAHALEAAAGYELAHGDAVALGLLAALRLSGMETDVVDEILAPAPVRVDRDAAWAALARDKKARGGTPRLVLLEKKGVPRYDVELPEAEIRAALDSLIAD